MARKSISEQEIACPVIVIVNVVWYKGAGGEAGDRNQLCSKEYIDCAPKLGIITRNLSLENGIWIKVTWKKYKYQTLEERLK